MDDLISRQAAIEALNVKCMMPVWCKVLVEKMLKDLPSVQPERKVGKWIWDGECYHCSECGHHAYGNSLECLDGTYRFCPDCGSYNRGGKYVDDYVEKWDTLNPTTRPYLYSAEMDDFTHCIYGTSEYMHHYGDPLECHHWEERGEEGE